MQSNDDVLFIDYLRDNWEKLANEYAVRFENFTPYYSFGDFAREKWEENKKPDSMTIAKARKEN